MLCITSKRKQENVLRISWTRILIFYWFHMMGNLRDKD